jgi:hypothetical protein
MLRKKERNLKKMGDGNEKRIERPLGESEFIIGTEPFAVQQMAGKFEKQAIVVTG